MSWQEEDYLPLSGLQHFVFCRRQWALIHIEQQWAENYWTVDGDILHEKAHDPEKRERRGDLLITRGMPVHSPTLGVSGQCDVVEFRRDDRGAALPGEEGLWVPFPVEYKRGRPKEHQADELQLCAQAMCLEEMLCCPVPAGALFYGEPRRRTEVVFTDELRERVRSCLEEMHQYYDRQYTPKVHPNKGCAACSLKDLCMPGMLKKKPVSDYLKEAMEE